uniref:Ig-like domain-containing protein n=1 Tax=Tetranychus urticae TaxID=32264 RepID=T1KG51_TETUR
MLKASYVHGSTQENNLSQLLSSNPEPASLVVAGEEGKAILPCSIDHPSNDTIDLILWFRGEDETALYSLDARKGPIQRAKQFPNGDSSSSHAYIDITGRSVQYYLQIFTNKVQAKDSNTTTKPILCLQRTLNRYFF